MKIVRYDGKFWEYSYRTYIPKPWETLSRNPWEKREWQFGIETTKFHRAERVVISNDALFEGR